MQKVEGSSPFIQECQLAGRVLPGDPFSHSNEPEPAGSFPGFEGNLSGMRRVVQVRYRGRLGNQLFEYAFGRLLAEDLGATFVASPIPGFPLARAQRASSVSRPSRPSVTIKNHWLGPRERAALKRKHYIELWGYFQRFEYYRQHRDRIADWFYRPRQPPLPEGSLTIHLRSGDVWNRGEEAPHPGYPALPISYYRRILDERPWSAVHLVCEHADDPIATQLLAIPGVTHEERFYLDDFDLLLASRNIALSVSSFSGGPLGCPARRRSFIRSRASSIPVGSVKRSAASTWRLGTTPATDSKPLRHPRTGEATPRTESEASRRDRRLNLEAEGAVPTCRTSCPGPSRRQGRQECLTLSDAGACMPTRNEN